MRTPFLASIFVRIAPSQTMKEPTQQPPSLPGAHPRSDRFRSSGHESNFPAVVSIPFALAVLWLASLATTFPVQAAVSLAPSLHPSPVKPFTEAGVTIAGVVTSGDSALVRLRVTTSFGETYVAEVKVVSGRFECLYP